MNDLQDISTKEDFIKSIKQLENDFLVNKNEWENTDIPNFLESLSAWINDMETCYKNNGRKIPVNINWQFFAEALYAAKCYE